MTHTKEEVLAMAETLKPSVSTSGVLFDVSEMLRVYAELLGRGEWRTIESAPAEVTVFAYHPMVGRFAAFKRCIDAKYNAYVWENMWNGESGIMPPTHWMPLPAAPEAKP